MSDLATRGPTCPALTPDHHKLLEGASGGVTAYTALIPLPELTMAIDACHEALRPMESQKAAAGAVVLLMAPFRANQLNDAKIAARLFIDRAQRYPEAVVRTAIERLHDTCKFAPTIAEFVEALDAAKSPLARRLWTAQAMQKEHARRQAEREREEYLARDREAYRARQAQGATS